VQLTNRKAIITGASQGLGFKIAEAFLKQGAAVTLCARNSAQLQAAVHQLNEHFPGAKVFGVDADVSRPQAVENLVKTAAAQMGGIDTLVANAGIHGPKGNLDSIDWEEWSAAIDVNLKGSVLVCKHALPYLRKNNSGKIILLSGGGATKPMPFMSAYAASKAAVVRFGETLAMELADCHIDVNCVAPGALNTRLLEDVLTAGPEKVGARYYEQCLQQKASGGSSIARAADLCVYLASPESDGITGKLISAVWDPWPALAEKHKAQLLNSDIFTLRRIVPEDNPAGYSRISFMVLILRSAEPMLGIKGEIAPLFSPLGSPIGEGIV
jgi:NAD(P)-dependent dehydrogenase (short-subunit alcohol dehydrogenase family)